MLTKEETHGILLDKLGKFNYVYLETYNGWNQLLIDALGKIINLLEKSSIPLNYFQIDQIKQKFGTLRFYWSWLDPENKIKPKNIINKIEQIINKTEQISASTCENCGLIGRRSAIKSWCFTLCQTCEQEIKQNSKESKINPSESEV